MSWHFLRRPRQVDPVADETPQANRLWAVTYWCLLFPALVVIPSLFMGLHADDWFLLRPRDWSMVRGAFFGDWNMGEQGVGGFYRPLVILLFHANGVLLGYSAAAAHLVNAALFGLVCAAVWRIGDHLRPQSSTGFFAALVLLVTPVKNEALFWVSGRTDLLAAAFALWALRWWMRWIDVGGFRRLLASLVLLLGAFLSKETALVMAAIFPLFWWLLADGQRRRAWMIGALLPLLLAAGFFLWRHTLLGGLGGYRVDEPRTLGTLLRAMLIGPSAFFWPWQCTREVGGFSIRIGLIATTATLLAIWALRFPRLGMLLVVGITVLLVPTVFAPLSPTDGTRLLLLPLTLFALLLSIALSGRLGRIIIVVGAVFLIPTHWQISGEFIRAGRASERLVRSAVAHIESRVPTADAPVVVICANPSRLQSRRILDPGATLDLAIANRWTLRHPGTTWAMESHRDPPFPGLTVRTHEGPVLYLAPILSPDWPEGILLRQRGGLLVSADFRAAEEEVAPTHLRSGQLVAARLEIQQTSQPHYAVIAVDHWTYALPFFPRGDDRLIAWVDTINAPDTLEGPLELSTRPDVLRLHYRHWRAFDLGRFERITP